MPDGRPRFYIAETTTSWIVAHLKEIEVGRMAVRQNLRTEKTPGWDHEVWAFDNGAFRDWKSGLPFQETTYLKWLERVQGWSPAPRFAVVPDIVGGGYESLQFSLSWRLRLPWEWTRWFLVVQDGMLGGMVEDVLEAFDGIFLGGTDDFKQTAPMWADLAHSHGKPMHYGRCGTPTKMRHAVASGADSFDSAYPLWTRDRFFTFLSLWQALPCDPVSTSPAPLQAAPTLSARIGAVEQLTFW